MCAYIIELDTKTILINVFFISKCCAVAQTRPHVVSVLKLCRLNIGGDVFVCAGFVGATANRCIRLELFSRQMYFFISRSGRGFC